MDNNELDWLELAREAAETSADYRDREGEYYHSIGREWAEIATIRARIAQAAALALALIALVIAPGLAHRAERWQRRRGR